MKKPILLAIPTLLMMVCLPASLLAWNARAIGNDEPGLSDWEVCFDPDRGDNPCDLEIKGHNWITNKAIKLLKEKGYNLGGITWDDVRYIHHGLSFADHPDEGPPKQSQKTVPTVRDDDGSYYGDNRRLWWTSWCEEGANCEQYDWEYSSMSSWKTHSRWINDDQDGSKHPNLHMQARWYMGADNDIKYAADNLFHYYRELGEDDQRISGYIVSKMRDTYIKGTVGANDYGTILYNLARRFWPLNNSKNPDLGDLPYVKAGIGGTGQIWGDFGADNCVADLPSTFLGGSPFICSRPSPEDDLYWYLSFADEGNTRRRYYTDTCRLGNPTWPNFVPTANPDSQKSTFRNQMKESTPSKQRNAALVYLGWALHMIQDLTVKYHAERDCAESHGEYEEKLDEDLLDDYAEGFESTYLYSEFKDTIDQLFDQPKANFCESFGLADDINIDFDKVFNSSISDGTEELFYATAEDATDYKSSWWPTRDENIHKSVLATMKLLACFDLGLEQLTMAALLPLL